MTARGKSPVASSKKKKNLPIYFGGGWTGTQADAHTGYDNNRCIYKGRSDAPQGASFIFSYRDASHRSRIRYYDIHIYSHCADYSLRFLCESIPSVV